MMPRRMIRELRTKLGSSRGFVHHPRRAAPNRWDQLLGSGTTGLTVPQISPVRMPRISDRQITIKFVKKQLLLNIALESPGESDCLSDSSNYSVSSGLSMKLTDSDSSDSDFNLLVDSDSDNNLDTLELEGHPTEVHEMYFVMFHTRYFVDGLCRNFFDALLEKMFRQMTHMNKNTFFDLVRMIENNVIFVNNSTHPQALVEWQLAVTLDRLGHNGNGACLNHMIPTWGVSNGSLVNFTLRVFTALELALEQFLRWPNVAQRHEIQLEFAKLRFPNCIGLLDGSLHPLVQRPKTNGECYFDHKSRYSINSHVVCDHKRRILFLFTGMPSFCCDITCFRASPLYRHFHDAQVFSGGQYLLGDSGYMNGTHIVAAYKRSMSCKDKEDFNFFAAKARVTNEHCLGVLKARWHSLKEIRIQLNEKKDILHMVRWIGLCVKLHNYVISKNDIWSEDDEPIEIDEVETPRLQEGFPLQGSEESPTMLIKQVQKDTLAWNRRPGAVSTTAPTSERKCFGSVWTEQFRD